MPRGIVLTNGSPGAGMVYNMVLIFEDNYLSVRDFKLIAVNKQKTKKQIKQTPRGPKEIERLVDADLLYGQTLAWDEYDEQNRKVEFVYDYARVQPVYPCRISEGKTQLLLHGIMSRNRKVLWMCNIWPDLEIPYRIQHDAHPNVVVNAWVTVQIEADHSLTYELHSFHDTADSFQHCVKDAKWNEGIQGFLQQQVDPLDNTPMAPEFVQPISDMLTGMKGYVLSKKIVIAYEEKHKDVCFHRIVIRDGDRYPAIGTYVTFKADRLDYLNIYAIKEVTPAGGESNLPVTKNGLVQVSISKTDHDGFYYAKALKCYVDDPENHLEAWLISKYSNSTLRVGITAAEPSAKGNPRFVVGEITDGRLQKIEEFKKSDEYRLKDEPGIVVDFVGTIHAPRLPKSNFRISAIQREFFPPGTQIFFSAKRASRRWTIESIRVNERTPTIRAVIVRNVETEKAAIWFHVPRARGCKELPFLLNSPQFGLLQTPNIFRIRRQPDHFTFENIWISLNDCHPGEAIKPFAKFKYAAMDDIEAISQSYDLQPIPTVIINCVTPDYPELSDLESQKSEVEDVDEVLWEQQKYNETDVPEVYDAMGEDQYQSQQEKYKGVSVYQMLHDLQTSPEWRRSPSECIVQLITEHLSKCTACSQHQFSYDCYFNEFLANVLQIQPNIAPDLKQDIVSMIATRRYQR
ncbi:hypothetical protein L3Y34_000151 [Caenorhabditis briggsae]|uniref:Uncharacterized protein n=1 Tax=Caenorhabditis briggsae TaxID=6238 RepID=A0AAE9IMZ8_CAEBR|nr:hypothetical protein L3Y34_000151 [Caenorhabditis briggsae]